VSYDGSVRTRHQTNGPRTVRHSRIHIRTFGSERKKMRKKRREKEGARGKRGLYVMRVQVPVYSPSPFLSLCLSFLPRLPTLSTDAWFLFVLFFSLLLLFPFYFCLLLPRSCSFFSFSTSFLSFSTVCETTFGYERGFTRVCARSRRVRVKV